MMVTPKSQNPNANLTGEIRSDSVASCWADGCETVCGEFATFCRVGSNGTVVKSESEAMPKVAVVIGHSDSAGGETWLGKSFERF